MAIQELAENENLSIVLLCEIAEVSRAAYKCQHPKELT